MTQAERAEALGITPRQLRRDEAKGCPKDLDGARTWRAANVHKAEATGDLNEETTRLRAAQADLAELDAAEKRGELVPLDEVQVALNEVMVIVGTQLEGLAGRVAAQVAGMTDAAEIRQFLKHETARIRTSAVARLEDWARGVEGGEAAPSAADKDAGRVGRPDKGASAGKR